MAVYCQRSPLAPGAAYIDHGAAKVSNFFAAHIVTGDRAGSGLLEHYRVLLPWAARWAQYWGRLRK